MLPSLQEGCHTFTRSRITEIFKRELSTQKGPRELEQCEFKAHHFQYYFKTPDHRVLRNSEETKARTRDWCRDFVGEAKDTDSHLQRLDALYVSLAACIFPSGTAEENELAVESTLNMITRLPAVPLEFRDPEVDPPYIELETCHFLPDSDPEWENLRVAHYLSSNTIRVALMTMTSAAEVCDKFFNLTTTLLRTIIDLSRAEPSTEHFLAKAFLWTSSQRMMMFYHSKRLTNELMYGGGHDMVETWTGIEELKPLLATVQNCLDACPPPYVCNWALRRLREDQQFIIQDLRRFFQCFSRTFGCHRPRCAITNTGDPAGCEGRDPKACLRLAGMVIENQSAHAYDCNGNCDRLYWNEQSWRGIGGAAAVSLRIGSDGLLRYVKASNQTMAASHVWSHGQGGRPENDPENDGTGLNRCLHNRFSRIAKSFGCDSYWMDTPCIPTDHALRRDAISNINQIFANSQLTLICDRDLMEIDVQQLDIDAQESLLATLLVCDWDGRSWTLLEALRGRQNLYILCKEDLVVSLKEVMQAVCQQGCIEFAALLKSVGHLIPTVQYIKGKNKDHSDQYQKWVIRRRKGFVQTEDAANLLAHRHASRPGDEIVIWSLLTGEEVFYTAEDFWRAKCGVHIRTGWLLSDIPRMEVAGRTWAPSRPDFPLSKSSRHHDYDQVILPYSGGNTRIATVHEDGLRSEWFMHCFQIPAWHSLWLLDFCHLVGKLLGLNRFMVELWFALRQAGYPKTPLQKRYAILKACHPYDISVSDQQPPSHPRRPKKDVFAVVSSASDVLPYTWKWMGLLEVDKDTFDVSQFRQTRITIA